ncbi:MAG TPA: TSUP family transporter [Tepidisphaeraceae bacterium]|jgi:uncharacterized membrane protein YfcA
MVFWWAVIFLAVFLIGVTKSGFGSGVGLMIVPMMAIAMAHVPGRGSEAALGLLLPLLIIGDLLAVYQYRKLFLPRKVVDAIAVPVAAGVDDAAGNPAGPVLEYPSSIDDANRQNVIVVIKQLLPGTIIGVILGGLLLYSFHARADLVGALIRIEIGIESVLLVSLHWWRMMRGMQQHLLPEPWRSHITGAFAAVSSTLAHAAGPIIAMYLLPLRLDRRIFVGTCAIYFFLLNSAKLPAYYASHMFEHAELGFTLKFLPLLIAGALFGFWVNKRLSDKIFTKVVYFVTFALGWYILYDGARLLMAHLRA